jgi:hypothetical protein
MLLVRKMAIIRVRIPGRKARFARGTASTSDDVFALSVAALVRVYVEIFIEDYIDASVPEFGYGLFGSQRFGAVDSLGFFGHFFYGGIHGVFNFVH